MRTIKTKQVFLENFETATESEMARMAGVSRQRMHQIEREFQVCEMVKIKKKNNRCVDCGIPIIYYRIRCKSCHDSYYKYSFTCAICGNIKTVKMTEIRRRIKEGRPLPQYCSTSCYGVWRGKNHGGGKRFKPIEIG